jgi:hypothetical protein
MASGKVLRDGAPVLWDGVGLGDIHPDLSQDAFHPALMPVVEMIGQGQRGMKYLSAVEAENGLANS